jgi:hypothetical protein
MRKYILFHVLIFLIGIKLNAQTAFNSQQLGIAKDKKTGCDFFTFNSQSRTGMWSGGCSNGFINGPGIMKVYQNDTLIVVSNCNYTNGYKNGYTIDSSIIDGSVFSGFCVNGKRDGKGKIVYRAGDYYEGDFKDGKLEGKGKFTFTDGSIYEGEWKDNMPKNGKMVFPNGTYYEGDFKEDKFEGKGKLVSKDGSSYEGDWKNGIKEGKGKYTSKDGTSYEGDWKNGFFEGKGKYVFTDGSFYVGEWKNNKREGKGKNVYADKTVYDGEWKNDKREGKGKFIFNDGTYYIGDLVSDEFHGYGTKYSENGKIIFEGEFEHNKSVEKNSNQNQSSISTTDKILSKLTTSERQYLDKLSTSNDDPKGIVGKKCGVSYTKCKWCGKTISYNKEWASRIASINVFTDPLTSGFANIYMGMGEIFGSMSGEDPVEKWSQDLKSDLKKIKAGEIYFCSESTPPKFCSKKCEYEFNFH